MRALLTLLVFFAVIDAFAFELQVSKMTKSRGYEGRFTLKTNAPEKVVLDCQSFVQGLLFGENGETGVMLQEWECEEVMTGMKKSLGRFKKHCLEIDEEEGSLLHHQECV